MARFGDRKMAKENFNAAKRPKKFAMLMLLL